MKGRKPKPNNLKVVQGNPGNRPMNEQEPVYNATVTDPPEWLTEAARPTWDRLAACLDMNGMLTDASRDLLAVYCDLLTDYQVRRGKGEMPPMAQILRITSLAGELGFTPSAASRIIAPRRPGKADGKDRFFG